MKRILLVCGGNTDRSPMAKAILEKLLQARNSSDDVSVDSAAYHQPTHQRATEEARSTIKSATKVDVGKFDLIITMEEAQKAGLSPEKTYTLKEIAGAEGNIKDPYNESMEVYRKRANEIKDCLEKGMDKILGDHPSAGPKMTTKQTSKGSNPL